MPGFFKSIGNFFAGTPEKRENVSTLRPEQEEAFQQLLNSIKGQGAGGAFGQSSDYFRNLLGDDSADFNSFAAPQMRQYNEDIVPGLSEQFAGMGAGGLNSSGFRNAQTQGATDLAERLGAIRANLRQSGAQGLQNLGQMGLGNFSQNMVTQPGTSGLLGNLSPAIGSGIGSYFGNKIGQQTSPYGQNGPQASPTQGFNQPNFMRN